MQARDQQAAPAAFHPVSTEKGARWGEVRSKHSSRESDSLLRG